MTGCQLPSVKLHLYDDTTLLSFCFVTTLLQFTLYCTLLYYIPYSSLLYCISFTRSADDKNKRQEAVLLKDTHCVLGSRGDWAAKRHKGRHSTGGDDLLFGLVCDVPPGLAFGLLRTPSASAKTNGPLPQTADTQLLCLSYRDSSKQRAVFFERADCGTSVLCLPFSASKPHNIGKQCRQCY